MKNLLQISNELINKTIKCSNSYEKASVIHVFVHFFNMKNFGIFTDSISQYYRLESTTIIKRFLLSEYFDESIWSDHYYMYAQYNHGLIDCLWGSDIEPFDSNNIISYQEFLKMIEFEESDFLDAKKNIIINFKNIKFK